VNLFKAELRRLAKRRFILLMALGAVATLALIAGTVFLTHEKPTPEALASARVEATRQYEAAVKQTELDLQTCQAAQGTDAASNFPDGCEGIYRPQPEDFKAEWMLPPTFDFLEAFPLFISVLALVLAAAGFVIGSSFVGAEWSSGAMMNLLLWRPRRLQVLGTKLAALLAVTAVASIVLSALWTGAFALIAAVRGTFDGMTSGAWQSMMLTELRGLIAVLVVTAIGFGLASVGRHTAVALGVVIAGAVALQGGVAVVLAAANVRYVEAYLLPAWGMAWMDKSYTIQDWDSACEVVNGTCRPAELTLTWPMAGGLLAAGFALVVGLAMWTMRKRDVA
jgi:ABC-2 type transport system permease protein